MSLFVGYGGGARYTCPYNYKAISCSCGYGCGSYHYEDDGRTCVCECGGDWTRAVCMKCLRNRDGSSCLTYHGIGDTSVSPIIELYSAHGAGS